MGSDARFRLRVIGCRSGAFGAAASGYLVRSQRAGILLDCGMGIVERLWRDDLLGQIDAIVISHMHYDHMIDVLPFTNSSVTQALANLRGPRFRIPLYVPRGRGPQRLDGLRALAPNGFAKIFHILEYDEKSTISIEDVTMTFARTTHGELCFAPRLTNGERILVYTGDAALEDGLVRHSQDASLLLSEAQFAGRLPPRPDTGHMTGMQAGELASRAGAERLVLTHLPPTADGDRMRYEEAQEVYAGPVETATEATEYTI